MSAAAHYDRPDVLTIRIELGNAAFGPGESGLSDEVARILRALARQVESGPAEVGDAYGLRDHNGNRVGHAEYARTAP